MRPQVLPRLRSIAPALLVIVASLAGCAGPVMQDRQDRDEYRGIAGIWTEAKKEPAKASVASGDAGPVALQLLVVHGIGNNCIGHSAGFAAKLGRRLGLEAVDGVATVADAFPKCEAVTARNAESIAARYPGTSIELAGGLVGDDSAARKLRIGDLVYEAAMRIGGNEAAGGTVPVTQEELCAALAGRRPGACKPLIHATPDGGDPLLGYLTVSDFAAGSAPSNPRLRVFELTWDPATRAIKRESFGPDLDEKHDRRALLNARIREEVDFKASDVALYLGHRRSHLQLPLLLSLCWMSVPAATVYDNANPYGCELKALANRACREALGTSCGVDEDAPQWKGASVTPAEKLLDGWRESEPVRVFIGNSLGTILLRDLISVIRTGNVSGALTERLQELDVLTPIERSPGRARDVPPGVDALAPDATASASESVFERADSRMKQATDDLSRFSPYNDEARSAYEVFRERKHRALQDIRSVKRSILEEVRFGLFLAKFYSTLDLSIFTGSPLPLFSLYDGPAPESAGTCPQGNDSNLASQRACRNLDRLVKMKRSVDDAQSRLEGDMRAQDDRVRALETEIRNHDTEAEAAYRAVEARLGSIRDASSRWTTAVRPLVLELTPGSAPACFASKTPENSEAAKIYSTHMRHLADLASVPSSVPIDERLDDVLRHVALDDAGKAFEGLASHDDFASHREALVSFTGAPEPEIWRPIVAAASSAADDLRAYVELQESRVREQTRAFDDAGAAIEAKAARYRAIGATVSELRLLAEVPLPCGDVGGDNLEKLLRSCVDMVDLDLQIENFDRALQRDVVCSDPDSADLSTVPKAWVSLSAASPGNVDAVKASARVVKEICDQYGTLEAERDEARRAAEDSKTPLDDDVREKLDAEKRRIDEKMKAFPRAVVAAGHQLAILGARKLIEPLTPATEAASVRIPARSGGRSACPPDPRSRPEFTAAGHRFASWAGPRAIHDACVAAMQPAGKSDRAAGDGAGPDLVASIDDFCATLDAPVRSAGASTGAAAPQPPRMSEALRNVLETSIEAMCPSDDAESVVVHVKNRNDAAERLVALNAELAIASSCADAVGRVHTATQSLIDLTAESKDAIAQASSRITASVGDRDAAKVLLDQAREQRNQIAAAIAANRDFSIEHDDTRALVAHLETIYTGLEKLFTGRYTKTLLSIVDGNDPVGYDFEKRQVEPIFGEINVATESVWVPTPLNLDLYSDIFRIHSGLIREDAILEMIVCGNPKEESTAAGSDSNASGPFPGCPR